MVKCAEISISICFYKSIWQLGIKAIRRFIFVTSSIVNLSWENTSGGKKKNFLQENGCWNVNLHVIKWEQPKSIRNRGIIKRIKVHQLN